MFLCVCSDSSAVRAGGYADGPRVERQRCGHRAAARCLAAALSFGAGLRGGRGDIFFFDPMRHLYYVQIF